MMRGWGIIIDRKILLDKSPPPGDTGTNRGVKDMIDVKSLEMTADKSRYFVRRGELEETLYRLKAAEDALAIAEHYRDTFRRDAYAEAGRLEAAERERDHFKTLAESRWDGAIEANQERDALSAHVAEIHALWLGAHDEEKDSPEQNEIFHRINEAVREHQIDPETSLARLIAEKQAEALEDLGVSSFVFDPQELFDRADELRRHAEAQK